MKENSKTEQSPKEQQPSIKDTSYSKKTKRDNSSSNSSKAKQATNSNTKDPTIEIESEDVKVVRIPGSTLIKAYYWKKENVTFLAIGQVGIEKRAGDQTTRLQEEYEKMGTDQMIKVIAAMIEAQKSIKKN